MDRGIPTEAHLAELRACGTQYLVGTPKGRLRKFEQARLLALQRQRPTYETLPLTLGAEQQAAGRAAALVVGMLLHRPGPPGSAGGLHFPAGHRHAPAGAPARGALPSALEPDRHRSGPALGVLPAALVEVEAAFKTLKDELAVRPIYHQRPGRIAS